MSPAGVLVADDNPANLRLMVSLLREAGHAVRVAPGGRAALASVRARPPALILLDIRMPDINGFEVCRQLKADPASRDIPVIFLSALVESGDKLRGFELGAVDYITKPFVAEEVLARVQTHLALRELRRALEDKVASRTRALRTLSAGNQAVVHAESIDMLLDGMCKAIVQRGGYPAATVRLNDQRRRHVGKDRLPDHCLGAPPDGPCLTRPARLDCPDAQATDGQVALLLPLRHGHDALGILIVHADQAGAFADAEDIELLRELAGDLAYGIETLTARSALENSLEHTIEAIAATLEVRDPYTAGHQRRATRIAAVIGREMGLDEDRLKGLFVAGAIHDIGKVSVPVEILSRPGKLGPAEFEIIKGHPVAGHDIIKGIDFPWPVAQIVRQHHERLDGSGYPDGLAGEQILLEARILAVADVVEAISSHRPYRPALGLDVAMQELKTQRGRLYDPDVVDVCLKLIEANRLPLDDNGQADR